MSWPSGGLEERAFQALREARVQGCSSGKNKVCSFKECSGGQWARGRLWEGMVGAKAGCRAWRETQWEKGKESMRSRIPESSSSLSQCHTLACSDLWAQEPCSPRCSDGDAGRRGGVHSGVREHVKTCLGDVGLAGPSELLLRPLRS